MAGNIIVDTGAIVALTDHRERHHVWSKKQAGKLPPPFYTCESVLSESFHLLQRISGGLETLIGFLDKDLIKVNFRYVDHAQCVMNILTRYDNLPASFADACLVCMYETTRSARIFTLDTHFNIYRTSKGKTLSLISPYK